MPKKNPLITLFAQFGPLRAALLCLAVIVIVLVPEPGTPGIYVGWAFLWTVLIPVLVPVIFMVLMLDTLMSSIFLVDKEGAERRRFKTIIFTNVLLGLGIVYYWLPYYLSLTQ